MSLLVPVAVALLATAQLPLATQLPLPSGETGELSADLVVYEADKKLVTARGHCELRTGDMLMRADEVTYDEATQVAVATGNVTFVGPGGLAAVADRIRTDLKSYDAVLEGGLVMQKKGVTLDAMRAAKTPQDLRSLGETPVLLSGTHIRRTGPNAFTVEGLALSPCECKTGESNWRIEASSASVVLGERATLSLPVVYVHSVPVFALPWLYLPLSNRRTGLLVPKPSVSSISGFGLEQPLFITLGPSYDVTLSPGFFTGGGDVSRTYDPTPVDGASGDEVSVREPRTTGVKGPRLQTEFRYMPSEHTRGRATLGLLYDLRPRLDPRTSDFFRVGNAPFPAAYVDEKRGLRGEASWQHVQDLGGGWHDRVDASFVSDGSYTRDLTADIIAREVNYLRSTATVYQRQDDLYAGLDVSLRQDTRWAYRFFQDNRVPAATDPARPDLPTPRTFQRLPGLTLALADRPLGGSRWVGGLHLDYTRLAPMTSGFGDEGFDDIFRPDRQYLDPATGTTQTDTAQSNGLLDAADREARDRLDFFPRVSTSFGLGDFARVTPMLALRQDVWVGEVSGRSSQRGHPLAGLTVTSELARTFTGKTSTVRHAIAPSLELRYVPFGWGRTPGAPGDPDGPAQVYDEVDAAVPLQPDGSVRGFLHAVLAVDQSLRVKRGTQTLEPLRLRLGQDFDLTRYAPVAGRSQETGPVLRDSFARLSASLGILSAGGLVRMDPRTGDVTQLSADFTIDNGRAALYARYDDLLTVSQTALGRGLDPLSVGPDALRRRLDTLVGSASQDVPGLSSASREQALVAGTRLALGFGLGVRYEAIVQPLYQNTRTQDLSAGSSSSPLAQQTLGVSYGPACGCWRVEGVVTLRRDQALEFTGVNLIVDGFGSFGSGG